LLDSLVELPESGLLAGRRYCRSGFEPRVSFAVPDGEWAVGQAFEGFFDIQREPGTPDVIAVQLTTTDAVLGADLSPVDVRKAREAIDALQQNPTLTVVDAGPISIDGHPGERLTVDAAGNLDAHLLRTPPGVLSMLPGRRLRLLLLDVEGRVLAILVGGSVRAWAQAEAAAQPILDSIRLES
jgi:hypothetical protein